MKKLLPVRIFFCCFLFSNSLFAAPGNDLCASVTTLTSSTSCSNTGGTLFQATNTGSPTSNFGVMYDVWYKVATPASVNTLSIAVSSLGSNLNSNNMFIEVFNASACGSISTATSIGTASVGTGITLGNLSTSTTYYFRIFTTTNPTAGSNSNWTFNICVTHSTTIPANNDCSGAVTIIPGTTVTTGTVANATATTGISVGCATGTPDDDVWYQFTAVRTYATIAVSASSTLYSSGAMIQVFSGASCGSLVSMACGKDAVNLTGLTVTQTYYVRVYSSGTTGTNEIAGAGVSGAAFNISVTPAATTTVTAGRLNEVYQQTNLSSDNIISDPWEITYGPDNYLWITEAKGYRVFRMDPVTGARTTVLDISKNSTFLSLSDTSFDMQYEIGVNNPQGGLAGLALHPQFMAATSPQNYVYVSYIHKYLTTLTGNTGSFYTNRLVRFTYNTSTGKLESPISLCDTLPGSSDHNSQRMIIAPVSGTDYLFYAQGDMGAGQFANQYRTNKAQDTTSYEGKILRFNLAPDADANAYQKWIPNDNPYPSSAVWCDGIRNNQGFAYDTAHGVLYGSSHGPYSDDEINIIERYRNFGHPLVEGYAADNNYNGSSAGAPNTTSACPAITNESNNAAAIDAGPGARYKDPLFSAYAPNTATINNIWVTNPGNGGWPSEAWSGLDLYTNTIIPGWKNSLVAASLKWGRLVRLKLASNGTTMSTVDGTKDTVSYFGGQNRFRDLAFSPNGKDIYVVMDRSTTSSGPSNANPVVPACAGCVQKYTFLGYSDVSGSTIPNTIPVTTGVVNSTTSNKGTTVVINSTNNNIWVPITGPDGNIMAEIYANGNNLDTVTSAFYKNSGAIRIKSGVHYLDRNIIITPKNQPGSSVKVRLYMSKAEYDALDADGASGVSAITDLKILKNSDPLSSTIQSTATVITPTSATAFGASNGYVLQANISSFSSFYFATSNIILPVNLLSFKGTLQNNSAVSLQWQTTSEINTSYFTVERSSDGSSFSTIGNVTAHGNSTSTTQYPFTDNNIANFPSPIIYYRLKMEDRDGAFTYSNVISIILADITGRIMVYPNPAHNEVSVSIIAANDGTAQWQIIDNTGRVVLQNSTLLLKGSNVTTINLEKLSAGFYYLNVSGAGIDKQVKLQKL